MGNPAYVLRRLDGVKGVATGLLRRLEGVKAVTLGLLGLQASDSKRHSVQAHV